MKTPISNIAGNQSLRDLLGKAGMTFAEAGVVLGIGESMVRRYSDGGDTPPDSIVHALKRLITEKGNSMKSFVCLFAVSALSMSGAVFAGNHKPDPQPQNPSQSQAQHQGQEQIQFQGQTASAKSNSSAVAGSTSSSVNHNVNHNDSNAVAFGGQGGDGGNAYAAGGKGGEATATGGNSTATQTQTASSNQSQSASNEGVSNTTTISTTVARSAPSVAQGSIIPPGCGAGGNMGGSNSNGSGFLGFSWITRECHKYILAQNYLGLGMYDAACHVLNSTKTAKRAFRELGLPLPSCIFEKKEAKEAEVTIPVDMTNYVTRDELREHENRIVRGVVAK